MLGPRVFQIPAFTWMALVKQSNDQTKIKRHETRRGLGGGGECVSASVRRIRQDENECGQGVLHTCIKLSEFKYDF